jgi:two-component system, NarL family, response regulator DevR
VIPIHVLIVDDHQIVRQGLRSILDPDPRFEVIGEAATGTEALSQVKALNPNIVVLDFKLPDMSGSDLCRLIIGNSPETIVVILTAYFEYELVFACLQAGARGFLIKDAEQLNLPEQLMSVFHGHTALDPRAADILTEYVRKQKMSYDGLSMREIDVIRLIGQGLTNREIALQLHITENTVKGYVKEIFDKMGVHNRIEAIINARKRGML